MVVFGKNFWLYWSWFNGCCRLYGSRNWATDISGGAKFGYTLLSVVLISNIFAMILQHLAVKLGVVAERDLAQACRDHFPPVVNFSLGFL
jgi:manganese transport protein